MLWVHVEQVLDTCRKNTISTKKTKKTNEKNFFSHPLTVLQYHKQVGVRIGEEGKKLKTRTYLLSNTIRIRVECCSNENHYCLFKVTKNNIVNREKK